MLIGRLAHFISLKILEEVSNEEKIVSDELFKRKVSLILLYIFLISTLAIIGYVFNQYEYIIVSSFCVWGLRTVSGGNHSFSPDSCYVITLMVIMSAPLFHNYISSDYHLVLVIINLLFYLFLAPYSWNSNNEYWLKKTIILSFMLYSLYSSFYVTLIIFFLIPDQLIYNKMLMKDRM